jgi:gluconokinase
VPHRGQATKGSAGFGMTNKPFPARSPAEKVGGIFHFGRMIDKIRAHAKGELPEDHVPALGKGFDGRTVRFLGVKYEDVVARAKESGSAEEILQWAFAKGRKPSEEEIEIWNEFMRKLGWNDEVSETLARRKTEGGLTDRDEIQTMFQYIDTDEGRELQS